MIMAVLLFKKKRKKKRQWNRTENLEGDPHNS